MPSRDWAEPGEEDDSANGERTWEQETTVSSGEACAGHGAEGCLRSREPRHQLHLGGLGGCTGQVASACGAVTKEAFQEPCHGVCKERKSENLGLEAGREGQQGWKDCLGPACKGSCSVPSPIGREVPLRVAKHRCDTVRGVFQIHPPSCRYMSLRGLTHWRWGGQGGGC